MVMVSMNAPLNGQAGFQITNAVRCIWRTSPVRSPHISVPDYFFLGYLLSALRFSRPLWIDLVY
jgi:hypothetical protein